MVERVDDDLCRLGNELADRRSSYSLEQNTPLMVMGNAIPTAESFHNHGTPSTPTTSSMSSNTSPVTLLCSLQRLEEELRRADEAAYVPLIHLTFTPLQTTTNFERNHTLNQSHQATMPASHQIVSQVSFILSR
jgi:hypothetical protein